MGTSCSTEVKETPRELTQYERLDKIESIFLRDIKSDHPDYRVAQQILNERTLNGTTTGGKQVATHGWSHMFESNI